MITIDFQNRRYPRKGKAEKFLSRYVYVQKYECIPAIKWQASKKHSTVGNSHQVLSRKRNTPSFQIVVVGIDRSLKYRLKRRQGQEGEVVLLQRFRLY